MLKHLPSKGTVSGTKSLFTYIYSLPSIIQKAKVTLQTPQNFPLNMNRNVERDFVPVLQNKTLTEKRNKAFCSLCMYRKA